MTPAIPICGQGRCGTSAVLAMLDAGGVPVLGAPPSYEVADPLAERLAPPPGHAYKLLTPHLQRLPLTAPPVAVLMVRDIRDQALSWARLSGVTEPTRRQRRDLERRLRAGTRATRATLRGWAGSVVEASFAEMVADPEGFARQLRGIWPALDVEAAASAVHRRGVAPLRESWERVSGLRTR